MDSTSALLGRYSSFSSEPINFRTFFRAEVIGEVTADIRLSDHQAALQRVAQGTIPPPPTSSRNWSSAALKTVLGALAAIGTCMAKVLW